MSKSGAYYLKPGQAYGSFNRAGYNFTVPTTSVASSNGLGNANLRATPWYVERPLQLLRIGSETTVVGDAGSTLRLGVYADNGSGAPGNLVVGTDCTIPADVVAVSEAVLAQPVTLQPGVYWPVLAVQGVSVTQPTVRTISVAGLPIANPAIPGAGSANGSYNMSGVTGALPSTFNTTSISGFIPRIFVKVQ